MQLESRTCCAELILNAHVQIRVAIDIKYKTSYRVKFTKMPNPWCNGIYSYS